MPSGRIPSGRVCLKKGYPGRKKSHRIYTESVCISSHTQLCLQLVQEGQVAFEKALGVEKEIFLCKESVAEEEIFGEGIDEEEVAFKDCVSLRRES